MTRHIRQAYSAEFSGDRVYLLTIGEQLKIALYSCGFGYLLGLLFDLFEFVLLFLPKKKFFFVFSDITYMISVTFLMNLFSMAVDTGAFRLYIYASAALGWAVYYFTLGRLSRNVRQVLKRAVCSVFVKFKTGILRFSTKWREKKQKKSKKNEISSNLLLQESEVLLYNSSDLDFAQKGSGK